MDVADNAGAVRIALHGGGTVEGLDGGDVVEEENFFREKIELKCGLDEFGKRSGW